MPASKRRRAMSRAAAARTSSSRHLPGTVPAAPEAVPSTAATSRPRRLFGALVAASAPGRAGRRTAAPAPAAVAADRGRPRPVADPDDELMWGRLGLLVLLALVFVLQVLIDTVDHVVTRSHRPLLVDLFDFNHYPLLMLPSCVLLMPVARRLTHQPRTLRLLESLSLGAVYAILVLLLALAFVPVPSTAKTAQQIASSLTVSNVPGLVLGNLLALLATVQIYPSLNRMLSAPGRKARKRILARQGGAAPARSRRVPKSPPPRRRG